MAHTWFITGVDTGIGKTVTTSALAAGLVRAGRRVLALKPFETGCERRDGTLVGEDARTLAAACGRPGDDNGLYRFERPLAPSVAARLEGGPIDLDRAAAWVRAREREVDHLLVEGVGGLMVPLNDRETVLDWILRLEPDGVILVAHNRLGMLSQVLTAHRVLRSAGLPFRAVVLHGPAGEAGLAEETNTAELERWVSPVVPFPRLTAADLVSTGVQVAKRLTGEGLRLVEALGLSG